MGRKPCGPAFVIGVGMTKFIKPRGLVDYPELGFEASVKALLDADINFDDVEQAIACYCFGDSTCGQRVIYQLGMTQIPVYNVNNNCGSGSTGLSMARTLVGYGVADCVLVVGFEKMKSGGLRGNWSDRSSPVEVNHEVMKQTRGFTDAPPPAQMFGNAGREYMEKYGASAEDFAEIARINHEHSKRNPYSQFQNEYTLDQILDSSTIYAPLTKLQCCPTSDGGAAAVVVSQTFLDAHPHLKGRAVQIVGQCLATDNPTLFGGSSIDLVGYGMAKYAAAAAYAEAGVKPSDIKVCEVHDCFSTNEMCMIDAMGFSETGTAHKMVRNGDITYGGKMVINPSGGLISKGHPLGATGLAQCAELVWHLRGWANNRLVPGADVALQQNVGLGGAAVVTIFKRADGEMPRAVSDGEVGKINGLGYNPAVEAKGFTAAQVDMVRSRKARSDVALANVDKKVQSRF